MIKPLTIPAVMLFPLWTLGRPIAKPLLHDPVPVQYVLQYNTARLRVPGSTFEIGISERNTNGSVSLTEGWLKGTVGWNKYRIDVEGGSFSNGQIKLGKKKGYLKGDSITILVYARKWLLGGRGALLTTQRIPYNYETRINIITSGNIGRTPGDHIRFGIRSWFDNKQFVDTWMPVKKKKGAMPYLLEFDGGHLSARRGDWKIDNDPSEIKNDRVTMIAKLAKDTSLRDTLGIVLNYMAQYQCKVQAPGNGHDLLVTVDAWFDSVIDARLLDVKVSDSEGRKTYHYRINVNGGSIVISSRGGDGLDGNNGLDGLPGLDGAAGNLQTDFQTVTNADGTTQSVPVTTQGPGSDGGQGGNGDDGRDGNAGGDGGNIHVLYTAAARPYLSLIEGQSIPGKGGSGGRGGQGGRGGFGGNGNPNGNPGPNGMDGRSGSDGANGKPGHVDFRERIFAP